MTTSESGIPSSRLILPRRKYSVSTSALGGLSEPLPEVGVDFASPRSQLFIIELAVTNRPWIFTYRAYEPPGQLIRMVLDEVHESPYPHGSPLLIVGAQRSPLTENVRSLTGRSQSCSRRSSTQALKSVARPALVLRSDAPVCRHLERQTRLDPAARRINDAGEERAVG